MIGFAKKIGMTRLFIQGKSVAVTVLEFGQQHVLQTKTMDSDGYKAVQIGSVHKTKSNKAANGHVKKYQGQDRNFRFISEFRDFKLAEDKKLFDINDFTETDFLDITGTVIGRGFAGVVKRHGFAGQPASHGHDHVRAPGSIGSRWPQRVIKGKKMAGHMGANSITVKKVKVVALDTEKKLIFVNGSLPGANSSYLKIRKIN